jgi:hypothetical protein
MAENLIAFAGMVIIVSFFLGFVVWWGRRAARTKSEPPNREETRAPASPRRRSPVVSRPLHQEPRLMDLLIARLLRTERTNAESRVQERSPHQDARSDVQDRSFVQGVQGEILPNSREELQALIVAIRHKENGKTKQEAIERAFGVRKGGSEKWRRASELFDAATEPASRYRQYMPAELAVLQSKPVSGNDN